MDPHSTAFPSTSSGWVQRIQEQRSWYPLIGAGLENPVEVTHGERPEHNGDAMFDGTVNLFDV